jgi:hypothetical protein
MTSYVEKAPFLTHHVKILVYPRERVCQSIFYGAMASRRESCRGNSTEPPRGEQMPGMGRIVKYFGNFRPKNIKKAGFSSPRAYSQALGDRCFPDGLLFAGTQHTARTTNQI